MPTITYHEDDVVVQVDDQTSILHASIANRIPHFRECGGQGRCTTCRVQILDGIDHVTPRTPREERVAQERDWDMFTRLACQTRVTGSVRVRRLVRSPETVSFIQTETLRNTPVQEIPVGILVADIRSFTPFVDSHLPYDVYHILNRFFGELGEPILLNGGLIYQYVGDEIVGLFGVQGVEPEQACLGALRAGLGMIHALDRLNDRIEADFGVRLEIRVGAHYGPLIIGYLGHPAQREFSVVGDAMNVASRIENMNEILGTTFLASRDLLDHVPRALRTGFEGNVALKGKSGRHALAEILGFAEPDAELLVQETARRLLGDQERFARIFYDRLFAAAPDTRSLFSGDIESQGRMLTQVLQLAVYGLSRFNDIIPGLIALGRSHVGYGVGTELYPAFRTVFLDTLRDILADDATPDVEAAWGAAVDRILAAMRHGAHGAAAPSPSPTDAPA